MSKATFGLIIATTVLMFMVTNYQHSETIEIIKSEQVSIDSTNNYWAFDYYGFSCPKASFTNEKVKCEIFTTNYESLDDRIQELTNVIRGDADVELYLLSDKNQEVVIAIYENGRKVWHL